jgi:polyhydroxyalkanoate synthesis regulator phasin
MNTVTMTLDMLVERFVRIARNIQALRLSLGDTVLLMRKVGASNTEILRKLQAAMPEAKLMLGYAITQRTLDSLAIAAETFAADGGWISPDGLHHITRADIEPLGLTPDQVGTLAELVKSGKVKGKRVLRETARHAKDPKGDQGKNAKARLLNMLDKGSDAAPSKHSLAQLKDGLARLLEQRTRLDERIERQRAKIKAATAAEAEVQAAADAPKAKSAPRPRKRDRSRSQPTLTA